MELKRSKDEPSPRPFGTALRNILAPVALLLLVAIATIGIARVIIANLLDIKLWWFLLVSLPAAWPLFALRYHQRFIYGFIEVAVGAFTANQVYNSVTFLETKTLLTIAGAVYVVIRGIDNMDQGINLFCCQFIASRDRFVFIYYWNILSKIQIERRSRRRIYVSMIRPIWKNLWREFNQLNKGTDRATWKTPYWVARKNFLETFTNENIAKVSRVNRYQKTG